MIHFEIDGPIAQITIDADATRNALTPRMLCELADAFVQFRNDDALRVAIVTGQGERAFCSGGDLARTLPLLTGARQAEDEWDERLLSDPIVLAASGLRDFPLDKPVIAAVNGACMAAGFELLLGTDIRICSENAIFALPEAKRALIPFAGSLARLPRQIPYAAAMELMLTGEAISASEALRLGLVSRVVPLADLQSGAHKLAMIIAANGPLALQAIKRTVRDSSGTTLTEAYRIESLAKEIVMATSDAIEGPKAFVEKRPPQYQGK
jgi:enoyl-CoA hydratase